MNWLLIIILELAGIASLLMIWLTILIQEAILEDMELGNSTKGWTMNDGM